MGKRRGRGQLSGDTLAIRRDGTPVNTILDRITDKARREPQQRFTALGHILTPDFLMETWGRMNRRGASGVDKETTAQFGENLEQRCRGIVDRLKAKRYYAPPVRRVNIPKGQGKTRPLGIPTVEDRLVQRAVARILEAIYETDFVEESYGFRPGQGPHRAIKALRAHVIAGKTSYVFETDIRGFFNQISHEWLMRMLNLRIGDPVILGLIRKWLRAGVLEEGVVTWPGEGTPQGGPISPILANIFLHYALDLWFKHIVRKQCGGEVHIVRFADDFVACFQYAPEAARFHRQVVRRMEKFGLELAEEKTRLLHFGRFARQSLGEQGQKPESFDFLGFKHVCGTDSKGKFNLVRLPCTKSCRKFLDRVKDWTKRHMHWKRRDQQAHLTRMLNGFYNYFGLHHCKPKLDWIRCEVQKAWIRSLKRRSQRHKLYWSYLTHREWFQLPYAAYVTHATI